MTETIKKLRNMNESLKIVRNVLTFKYDMRYNTLSVEGRKDINSYNYNEFQRETAIN